MAKRRRGDIADAKITTEPGDYLKSMFFSKGDRRGVLAVYEHRMVWDVYADQNYSQHVEWNDPDSKCLSVLTSPCSLLHVLFVLNENGFIFEKELLWEADT